MVLQIFLVLMLIFAFLSVQAKMLRNAVIYLGVFSLISAVVYLLYQAPDVGLAEAIIGSTLTTILYLVALQKYKVITVYYVDQKALAAEKAKKQQKSQGLPSSVAGVPVLNKIEDFCLEKEYEMQVVLTTESLQELQQHAFDELIVIRQDDGFHLYASHQNYLYTDLQKYVCTAESDDIHLILT